LKPPANPVRFNGIGLASGVAEQLAPSQGPNGKRFLEKVVQLLGILQRNFVCVASFTEESDLLSQWRGYSGSGGVALGFDDDTLRAAVEPHNFSLTPCIYDDREKIRLITHMLLQTLRSLEGQELRHTQVWDLAEGWVVDFDLYASTFKHHSFAEEKEWRLTSGSISADLPQVAVRPGVGLPIPYFKLPLANQELERDKVLWRDRDIGLRSITIGPHREQELAENAMRIAAGTAKVRVESFRRSLIPYRSV
jgi:hypothetical protein